MGSVDATRWNIGLLLAAGGLWVASGTAREHPVMASGPVQPSAIESLEAEVARAPSSGDVRRRLAHAYLDAKAPGLALHTLESAPDRIRSEPGTRHLIARILIDEGRAADALAVERAVLATCRGVTLDGADESARTGDTRMGDRAAESDGLCSPYLVASATRRAEILGQLVALGVDDPTRSPIPGPVGSDTRDVRFVQ